MLQLKMAPPLPEQAPHGAGLGTRAELPLSVTFESVRVPLLKMAPPLPLVLLLPVVLLRMVIPLQRGRHARVY